MHVPQQRRVDQNEGRALLPHKHPQVYQQAGNKSDKGKRKQREENRVPRGHSQHPPAQAAWHRERVARAGGLPVPPPGGEGACPKGKGKEEKQKAKRKGKRKREKEGRKAQERISAIIEKSFQTSCTKAQLPKDTKVQRHKSTWTASNFSVTSSKAVRRPSHPTYKKTHPKRVLSPETRRKARYCTQRCRDPLTASSSQETLPRTVR